MSSNEKKNTFYMLVTVFVWMIVDKQTYNDIGKFTVLSLNTLKAHNLGMTKKNLMGKFR
jgi:hypothetical protein